MTIPTAPVDVQTAVAQGRWQVALDLLGQPHDLPLEEALELRAQAAYGAGEFEASITAWEELHTLHLQAGRNIEASRAAASAAMFLMMDTGLMAAVRGWLRRAEGLLEGVDDCPVHAVIATVRTYERFMCGDMEASKQHAARAIELGDRLGVVPASVIARVASARHRILDGAIDEGVGLLDEIAVRLASPEVDPLTTGIMYCELICAAQGLALHDRAAEWTAVMDHFTPGGAVGAVGGRCRVHRAEMLRFTGPCDAAEQEALAACQELRPWMRREFGWPLVELGTIRLRKGDLDGAEEAFLAAHQHGWFPEPGLALLRLEQGDLEAATALIADAIEHPVDIPSKERPPFGDLRMAPLFDAQVTIASATGDPQGAGRAAVRLRSVADAYPSSGLRAAACLAEGRAALAAGDLEGADTACRSAIVQWSELGAPFETASARMVLGDVLVAHGNVTAAALEFETAANMFSSFGAARWAITAASRAAALHEPGHEDAGHGDAGHDEPTPPPHPGQPMFRADGDVRRIRFGGIEVTVRDLKGLRYVARLLAEPGREFHVLDLVDVERGSTTAGPSDADGNEPGVDFVSGGVGAGLPMLDRQARDAYRRRLADVDDDIEDARRANDHGRLELAERDRAYLIAELSRAVGLGGAIRTTGGSSERARTSVTRSIRYALDRLAEHHADLAHHLGQRVKTGSYCCYATDPAAVVVWET